MPPTSFQQVASSSLSLPPQSYIYSLVPIPAALAAISSDDSLRLFDRETLQLLPSGVVITAHQGITCLTSASDELLASAGRDGIARTWDVRYGKEVSQFSHGAPSFVISPTASSLERVVDQELCVLSKHGSNHSSGFRPAA
jgi:WD40 repeat protein